MNRFTDNGDGTITDTETNLIHCNRFIDNKDGTITKLIN